METQTTMEKLTETELIREVYATTLDRENYDQLMNAIERFVNIDEIGTQQESDLLSPELVAHFQMAIALLNRMDRHQAKADRARRIVNQAVGVGIIFEPDGTIMAMNDVAHSLLNGEAKNVSELGFQAEALAPLRQWMESTNLQTEPGFMVNSVIGNEEPVILMATMIHVGENDEIEPGVVGNGQILLTSSNIRLDQKMATAFGALYGFSKTECEILRLMAEGADPAEIAKKRNASINTVRTHIRAILRKSGLHSMLALTRQVNGFVAHQLLSTAMKRKQDGAASQASLLRRRHEMVLSDGRRLSFLEQGAPDGRPVLFLHSLVNGVQLTNSAVEAARARGWRLIAPSRPGFGASEDVVRGKNYPMLDSFAHDCIELLDHLQIDKVLLLGHVIGSVYGARFARNYGRRTRGLLMLNHLPVWRDQWLQDMPHRNRILFSSARFTPSLVPFISKVIQAMFAAGQYERFLEDLYQELGGRYSNSQRQEIITTVCENWNHSGYRAVDAYCREVQLVVRDGSEDIGHIKAPISLLLGGEDSYIPKAMADYIRDNFADRVKIKTIPRGGHYLLYTHWQEVFAALESFEF